MTHEGGERRLEDLSPKLRQLVPLLGRGADNLEIASELNLAIHSVENYVSELKQEWGARDRVQLAFWAQEVLSD
jgi:DNA-binding NarL/FixJ family response regulator